MTKREHPSHNNGSVGILLRDAPLKSDKMKVKGRNLKLKISVEMNLVEIQFFN